MGLGTSIILKANASTGGTDMLAYVIKEYKPDYRTGNLIVMIDTVIIILNAIFFRKIEIGLYSAITIYLMGKVIDIVFEGINFTKLIYIISDKYLDISEEIIKEIERGITGIYAKGMYTNEEKMMLLCVASRNQAMRIKQISKKIDPRSFVIISNAREAFGLGFKR
ncbi:MAG: YitT family protein [Clostridia bacterium]|nr:YitT family protein [Clostridia bacterium]